MRKALFIIVLFCLTIFIGCLGTSMSGDNVVGTDIVFTNAVLSGRVFFADRQLYGGIPISIRYSGSPESNAAATIKKIGRAHV